MNWNCQSVVIVAKLEGMAIVLLLLLVLKLIFLSGSMKFEFTWCFTLWYTVNYSNLILWLFFTASKPAFSTTSTYTATTRPVTQATPKAASYTAAYTSQTTANYTTQYPAAAQTTATSKGMLFSHVLSLYLTCKSNLRCTAYFKTVYCID